VSARGWPPLTDPELLERQALSQESFEAFIRALVAGLGRREYRPVLLEHALGYPWERPERSYLLRDQAVEPLGDVEAQVAGRHPIVAIGSNAAPRTLAAKFAHLDDRTVPVSTGWLHGIDVGAAATPTIYGVLPATPFASPGTAVRAALLWLTPSQVTQLTWSELTYRLGRLERARFEADGLTVDGVFAYASRFGTLHLDGAPVALAAIPARGRRAPARTQQELLDAVARLLLGPPAGAAGLVPAIWVDMAAMAARAEAVLWPLGQRLAPEDFSPYPALPQ
jgi:hypothetical protein